MRDLAYLKLLAREYPTAKAASSEIINLTAIKGLPKGTEYFFSDLHGEHEAFIHLLRSSSGIIREKIKETFGYVIPEEDQEELANLIYYPEKVLRAWENEGKATDEWKRINIYRLVEICKVVSSKYTRSKVRKKLPEEFAYIIDELLHVDYNGDNKKVYYTEIIRSIIDIDVADKFIIALSHVIQNLTIDSLHIIGDIFDRGPRADLIMNELMRFHDVDIQWGNHDISWMGAATGNMACICNVLRSPSATTALTCWRMAMASICAPCPCLPPVYIKMTPVQDLCLIFWMRIYTTSWTRGWWPRCTRPLLSFSLRSRARSSAATRSTRWTEDGFWKAWIFSRAP